MYPVYTGIYAVYKVTSSTYTLIYPLFASHCLNRDLSNSDSVKPCNVFGMCLRSDLSIRDFPKGKEKLIQNIAGAWQDLPVYDRYIAAHDKYMACTYHFFLKCVFITFESRISCSLHVLCMLAYSNIRKVSPSMKTWWWHYSYVPVIYLNIPLYTVIWRYMRVYVGISGWQDSRWLLRICLGST
jgi:hypothetical protein